MSMDLPRFSCGRSSSCTHWKPRSLFPVLPSLFLHFLVSAFRYSQRDQVTMMIMLLFLFGVIFPSVCNSGTTCYMPNGTAVTSPAYQPCVQTEGTFSMCCGTNHSSPIVANDACLASGL